MATVSQTLYQGRSAAGTLDAPQRRRTARDARDLGQKTLVVKLVLFVAALLLYLVAVAALTASLNQKNTELQESNEYIQAEIDALQMEVGAASSIDKIEKTATETYGMVHPSSSNYVSIKDNAESAHLADVIKAKAYA